MLDSVEYIKRKYSNIKIYYMRLKMGKNKVCKIQGSKMKLDITTEPMKRDLLLKREIDGDTTRKFRETLINVQDSGKNNICVFELGAHQGYYSLIAASILMDENKVYAVEPSPQNVKRIKKNRELNNYEHINIISGAIGHKQGQSNLYLDKSSYKNRLDTNNEQKEINKIKTQVYTVDGLINEFQVPSDAFIIIRMDVEYHEKEAVKGMENLLESGRPMFIFAEIHNSENYSGSDILEKFEQHGFEIETLGSDDISRSHNNVNENIEILAKRTLSN